VQGGLTFVRQDPRQYLTQDGIIFHNQDGRGV
jgi:hypothetical protein